jgi:hypothetical protein
MRCKVAGCAEALFADSSKDWISSGKARTSLSAGLPASTTFIQLHPAIFGVVE